MLDRKPPSNAENIAAQPARCPLPRWARWTGLAAFVFFLLKGLAWLGLAALVWWRA